jgi:hypothetical protein
LVDAEAVEIVDSVGTGMLRQLQAELMRLAGRLAVPKQAGAGETARRLCISRRTTYEVAAVVVTLDSVVVTIGGVKIVVVKGVGAVVVVVFCRVVVPDFVLVADRVTTTVGVVVAV